ncbi:plastocyanin/azurin family copper-binding protein [Oscillospiraceae bacterium WX1]
MKKSKTLMISIIIILLLAAVAGCRSTSAGQGAATSSAGDKNTVNIQNFEFQPAEITVNKGETVTWINQDSAGHDVVGNSFKSDILQKGQSFQQTFNETGTFEYRCPIHSGMAGKVIVK